ncbi:MAG TPA: serine protease [Thermoanaerobaculia bacterium]|nr:serine protease [Thermoanaerobaculia bacterium]
MSPEPLHDPEDRSLGEHAAEILPDLDLLAEQLRADTGEALPKLAKVRALIGPNVFGTGQEITAELQRERAELLDFTRRAVEALRQCRGMEVRLRPEEEVGVQALLAFTSRPAILVQGDRFAEPPPVWADLDRIYRSDIETALRSVGRVEMTGHPALSWAGTAWVAAPGIVVTNRHVVQCFANQAAGTRWRIQDGMTARIDFGRELDMEEDEGRIFDVPEDAEILVHPVHDLALVPVAGRSRGGAAQLPPPLSIAADGGGIEEGRKVFVAGHPERDDRAPERLLQYRLFQGIFGVKRLQPGQVMSVLSGEGTLLHDCSTLGGNSGSPVVDLETNRVVGLHYAGFHRHANLAVALWQLADDPLLRAAGIGF